VGFDSLYLLSLQLVDTPLSSLWYGGNWSIAKIIALKLSAMIASFCFRCDDEIHKPNNKISNIFPIKLMLK
jgi:hypothetical protein